MSVSDIEDFESNEKESTNEECFAKQDGQLEKQMAQQSNGGEGHLVTLTATQHEALLLRLQKSEERALQCEENLKRALADMENIK